MTKNPIWQSIKTIKNCSKCNSKRSYTNPFKSCFECKKRFCYDCIWSGMVNNKMDKNEEVRNVCEKCISGLKYKTL